MRNFLLFLAGVVFGALLVHAPAVDAQMAHLMFGSNAGVAKAVAVDASGNIKVVLH
jgi:hypothetical protein